MKILKNKKGQVTGDKVINIIVVLLIVISVMAGVTTLILTAFGNVSSAGGLFFILFGSILPIILPFVFFLVIRKSMKF